jgi:N-acetylmuramic acid 6-phosphate etherase
MKKNKQLFRRLSSLKTERRNRKSMNVDRMKTGEVLRLINSEDRRVAAAVGKELRYVEQAVEIAVAALRGGGRLIYVGAGTSGRLGVLDAAECPPTFGTKPAQIVGLIAGGKRAVFRSREGSEDKVRDGVRDIRSARVGPGDAVCGIAASALTPYVGAAVEEAKRRGASTIFITTNPRSIFKNRFARKLRNAIDVAVCPFTGPEVVTGSTRMKAGTAQKMVLNMITTAAMIRLGKVYSNMMVDLRMNSRKLEERAKRTVMTAAGVDYDTAARVLTKAGGHVKTAIVMILRNVSAPRARACLKRSGGFVRSAITVK